MIVDADFIEKIRSASKKEVEEYLNGFDGAELERIVKLQEKLNDDIQRSPIDYFHPHDGQRPFLDSVKRNAWYFGGNASGKTVAGAIRTISFLLGRPVGDMAEFAPKGAPNHGWIGGPNIEHSREVMLEEIMKWIPRHEVADYKVGEKKLYMKNGSTLVLKSYDSEVEKWQGKPLDFLWFDEQPPYPIYREGMSRVNRRNGYIYGTMTPLYANSSWTYDDLYLKSEEDSEIGCYFSGVTDNVYLSKVALDRQIKSYEGSDEAAARLHGQFIILQGLIHPKFNMDKHVIRPVTLDKSFKYVRVIDLHTRAPKTCCWYAYKEIPFPMVYQVEELMIAGTSITDFASAIKIKDAGKPIEYTIVDTPESQDETTYGTNMVMELRRNGIFCTTTYDSTHLRNFEMGVHRANDYFAHDPPAIYIFDTCRTTIRQIRNYIWDNWKGASSWDKNPKEKPKAKEDHAVRNLHYFLLTMPSINEVADENRRKNTRASSRRRDNFRNYSKGLVRNG